MNEFRRERFDSEIFGYEVYKLFAAADSLARDSLRSTCAGGGARLVCCFTPHSPCNFEALADCGFRLISVRSTYDRAIDGEGPAVPLPPGVTVCGAARLAAPLGEETLAALAQTIGETSRYFKDRRVPRHLALGLYTRWLRNSLAGYAAEVLVATVGGEMAGLHAIRVNGECGIVDLIGVLPPWQGSGVGGLLLDAGIAWCAARNLGRMAVVTEAENVAASRFYERRGFLLRQTEFVWHWHRDSDAA